MRPPSRRFAFFFFFFARTGPEFWVAPAAHVYIYCSTGLPTVLICPLITSVVSGHGGREHAEQVFSPHIVRMTMSPCTLLGNL